MKLEIKTEMKTTELKSYSLHLTHEEYDALLDIARKCSQVRQSPVKGITQMVLQTDPLWYVYLPLVVD